ncbi:hypothetical protein GUJ93_ZPchr0005g14930 [Zizania palustris]|uniref:Uncharacterized protein n=1 Tax=Zizania palustris TaxID=103762 RepID=A0A8J5SU64_ZIZPA|nr:hypothetical protein GUJ93_ZPchr0005g14930 [Zizania palustris]
MWLTPSKGCRGRGRGSRGGSRGGRGGSRGGSGGSRGGRSRSRGGKVPRGIGSSTKIEFGSNSAVSYEKAPRKYARRGGRNRGRGRGRGLRTVRPRQPSDIGARSILKGNLLGSFSMPRIARHTSTVESPQSSGEEEWGLERRPYVKVDEHNSVSQSDESSEEISEPMNEYDEQLPDYSRDNSGSSPLQMLEDGSDDNDEAEEEGEDDGEDYDAEHHVDEDDEDADEMGEDDDEDNEDGGGGENADEDEDGTSYSSEYSK